MAIKTNCKALVLISLFINPAFAEEVPDVQQIFKQKCSFCHAIDKKKLGPAVTSMISDAQSLRQTISKGKNAMPAFENKLTKVEINGLVDYLLINQ